MHLFCPKSKSKGTCSVLVCLYNCKAGTKVKCPEYTKHFEQIKAYQIEPKYTERYGEPEYHVPYAFRRRKRRAAGGSGQKAEKAVAEANRSAKKAARKGTKAVADSPERAVDVPGGDKPKRESACGNPVPREPQKCEKHPRYQGIRRPSTDCPDCWALWKAKHDAA